MKNSDLNDKEKIKLMIYDLMEEFIKNKEYDGLDFCYLLNKITIELCYHFADDDKIATGLITRSWNEVAYNLLESDFEKSDEEIFLKKIH